ncbi:TonB-dependent receptor [Endozoicomonas sp. SM1973]|uniref:TonB-dependent receptor n=1 Tax=Spartinivicinus marinus TaxID=2994442 RepID=A0A853I335_9GAMM|nr:TonB-dependent receptor [Spartinivicinus marinus]MCX4030160.1 TonB-dependent receptor [Spartinivicinus marinus]NYZ67803.1 TonB-dependent receptor [Spartinivicinus marinus]
MKRMLLVISFSQLFANIVYSNDLDYEDLEVINVITPVKLKQSLKDSPNAVTIITKDMLNLYGITSIPEAMRLVPGMQVTYRGSNYTINYHGTNGIQSRRVNVIIDGISLYRYDFATIPWHALPVSINDISRIEVSRSPASSTYGANSLLAVVNIITLRPEKSFNKISTFYDSNGSKETFLRLQKKVNNTSIRLSTHSSYQHGFDKTFANEDYHSGIGSKSFNIRSTTDINSESMFEFSLSHINATNKIHEVESGEITNPDIERKDTYISGKWSQTIGDHHVQLLGTYFNGDLEQDWRSCRPTIMMLHETAALYKLNQSYVFSLLKGKTPSGGTVEDDAALSALQAKLSELGPNAKLDSCTDLNQDLQEMRATIELSDTYQYSENLRFVGTIGTRFETAESDTYFSGKQSLNTFIASINSEYKPSKLFTFNIGGFYERNNDIGGLFSPRFAVNYHLSPSHTFRASVTKSFRNPSLFEQRGNRSYTLYNIEPNYTGRETGIFFATGQSPGGLEAEKIISQEIGYFGHYKEIGTTLDIKIFKDRLYNLQSTKIDLFNFNPINNGSTELTGIEVESGIQVYDNLMLNFGIAYLDNSTDFDIEKTQYSHWTGFLATSYKFNSQWQVGGGYYGASNDDHTQAYNRYDFNIGYHPSFMKSNNLELRFFAQYQPNPRHDYPRLPNFAASRDKRNFKLENQDKTVLGIKASLRW